MSQTRIKIEWKPLQQILKSIGVDKNGKIQRFVTSESLRRIQKYMPYRTGRTIQLMIIQTNISKPELVLDVPYGKPIYYGISKSGKTLNYIKTKNRLAGPFWDRRMMQREGDSISRAATIYARRL